MSGLAYGTPAQGRLLPPALARGTGGFAVDYSASAAAQKETGIDASAFVQAAGAAGSIGQAIENTGEYASKMANQMIESVNRHAVDKSDVYMAQGNQEIAVALADEKDPRKWAEISGTIAGKWKDAALADKSLYPAAKDAIASRFTKWQIETGTATLRSAHDRAIQVETEGLEGARLAALAENNPEKANAITGVMVDRQLIGADTAERQKAHTKEVVEQNEIKLKAAEYKGYQNSVATAAATQPMAEVEKHINSLPIDAADKVKLINYAQGINRDGTASLASQVADGIASGTIPDKYELEATFGKSPFLTPALKKDMRDSLQKFNVQEAKLAKEGPGGLSNFVRTYTAAVNWHPKQHSEESARELYNMIADVRATVPDDYAGEVTQLLHQKFGSTTSDSNLKLRPEIQRQTSATINKAFDSTLLPQAAATAMAKKAYEADPGEATKKAYSDAAAKEFAAQTQAYATQADVEQSMKAWAEKYPEKATQPKEVMLQLNRELPPNLLINHMESLNRPDGARGETGAAGAEGHSAGLVDMVKDFEGFSGSAFGDFKQTSIGYGTRAKHEGETITKEEADTRLRGELSMHAKGVDSAASSGGYKLTPKQRDALISFDFNTGRAEHILGTAGGDLREVERRMRLYTKAGGKDQEGLIKRRKKEADIFGADITVNP